MNNHYKLRFKKDCSKSCDFCPDLGSKSEQNLSLLDAPRLGKKIQEYSSVQLPCNFDFSDKDTNFTQHLPLKNKNVSAQVHIDDLKNISKNQLAPFQQVSVLTASLQKIQDQRILCRKEFTSIQLVITKANQKNVIGGWLKLKRSLRQKVKFLFLQANKSKVKYLKCRQIHSFYEKLMMIDPLIAQSQFESDLDIFDSRVAIDMDLEASFLPIFENKINGSYQQISIVIPSYNNKNEVIQTLKFLNNQDFDKRNYEIILVDDGSTDGTSEFIINNFYKLGFTANLKLIHYPRIIPRKPGDQRFRAGLARNVGVKQATGEYLLFCDADIIFLKNSLQQIYEELKLHDVVQIKRYYLNHGVKVSHLYRSDFDIEKNSFHPNNGYWKDFYNDEKNWMTYRCPWKYICTFGLGLKKEDFINAGRFRKIFLNYGFEDTDLGYRLFKQGKNFKLSSVAAFHQFGKYERNEYSHNNMKRHMLLSNTAKIFYRHYVDPVIYKELPSFIQV